MKSIWKLLPQAAKPLLLMEGAERLSYYSYRSICTLFLVSEWKTPKPTAEAITQNNLALTYAMALVGAICADWFLGQVFTIAGFGLLCCCGHLLLSLAVQYDTLPFMQAIFTDKLDAYIAGLMLIGLGAGALKPANSGLFGHQFVGDKARMLEQAWRFFYTAINLGSLIGFMLTPNLADQVGWDVAFGFAGITMFISVLVVLYWQKHLVQTPPSGYRPNNFVTVNWRAFRLWLAGARQVWANGLKAYYPDQVLEEQLGIWRTIRFFALTALVTQGVYDLSGINWTTDALCLDRTILGVNLAAGSIQTANSIFVIILAPLSILLFGWLGEKGMRITVQQRMVAGIILIGLGTVMEAILADFIAGWQFAAGVSPDATTDISAWWQIADYFVLTCGEVLFMIGGLEAGFAAGSERLKSSVMAIWYLTTAAGNILTATLSSLSEKDQPLHWLDAGGNYYWLFCLLLLVNLGLIWRFRRHVFPK